jgi:hypothetical protein
MARNFDEARQARKDKDRQFTIGGEFFFMKPGVKPEVFAGYDDITPETTATQTLEMIDGIILDMVEPHNDAHARWHALRAKEDDPITLADMTSVVDWLIAEQTGRPTQQPSPSGPGPEPPPTGTTLTDDSPSPATPPVPVPST